jgi:hemerythrin-like domain-containing protein
VPVLAARAHVFFFDVRNTLGVVDRTGHLVPFRPSTSELLKAARGLEGARLAIITNVPAGVDAAAMLKGAGLDGYFETIISTQDPDLLAAKAAKPQRAVYDMAAARMGVPVDDCTYISENLIEVLGAINAGMSGVVKKFPPGGDYMRAPITPGAVSPASSGRLSEALLEGQHIVGKRIVVAAATIAKRLHHGESIAAGTALGRAMTRLVWLVNHFVDPYHHRMEEDALLPFAHMRGLPPSAAAWVHDDHEQGRAYFLAMTIALRRAQNGDGGARAEFASITDAFVQLYKVHGQREDDELFKQIGDLLTDEDDAIIAGMIERLGPPDISLHYDMINGLEADLEITP